MRKKVYLLPEAEYMEGLLKNIDVFTRKIAKLKKKMEKSIWLMPSLMGKISVLNYKRFQNIVAYMDVCNDLIEGGLETTFFFYMEQFDANYLESVFWEETNLMYLAKQLGAKNIEPDNPNSIIRLNYYILESVHMGFDLDFIRNCMDVFIADDKELRRYHSGVIKEYNKKLSREVFQTNDREKFENTRMNINCLFSMKCSPNNMTMEQSIEKSLEEEKEAQKSSKDGKKPYVKVLKDYNQETHKFNPLDNNPQKER